MHVNMRCPTWETPSPHSGMENHANPLPYGAQYLHKQSSWIDLKVNEPDHSVTLGLNEVLEVVVGGGALQVVHLLLRRA